MSDLIGKLKYGCPPAFGGAVLVSEIMSQAADEIERQSNTIRELREALTMLHQHTSENPTGAKGWNASLRKAEEALQSSKQAGDE